MPSRDAQGRVITFYSYKGGTGRSMALANVAWILANQGKRVLAVDWDLEAPGLHRYFAPFLEDSELFGSEGIIDFVWDVCTDALTPVEPSTEGESPAALRDLRKYAIRLNWEFHDGGRLDFIPAGRQDLHYAQRVNSFDWDNFYDRLSGGSVLDATGRQLRETYDFILIDSRTGVSDTAGICTVQLPDALVMLFSLNKQSVKGVEAVAASVRRQRPEMPIFPIPTRIDPFEHQKLAASLKHVKTVFSSLLRTSLVGDQDNYWGDVELPYVPYYAFEEILAAFGDDPGRKTTMLAAAARLAKYVSNEVIGDLPPVPEPLRNRVLEAWRPDAGANRTSDPNTDAVAPEIQAFFGEVSASAEPPTSEPSANLDSSVISLAEYFSPARTGIEPAEERREPGIELPTVPESQLAIPTPSDPEPAHPRVRSVRRLSTPLVLWVMAVVAGVVFVSAFLLAPRMSAAEKLAALHLASTRTDLKTRYLLDLYRADYREFKGVDLSGVILTHDSLQGIDLSSAKLTGARLAGAVLDRAKLSGADLSGADLNGASLTDAVLWGARVDGADLSGANLSGANLDGVPLDRARTNTETVLSDSSSGPVLPGDDLGRQVRAPSDTVNPNTVGYMWIGRYDRNHGWVNARLGTLQGNPVTADPERIILDRTVYRVRSNSTLRDGGWPTDSSYFDLVRLGTVRQGARVEVLERPRRIGGASSQLYWARVKVNPATGPGDSPP